MRLQNRRHRQIAPPVSMGKMRFPLGATVNQSSDPLRRAELIQKFMALRQAGAAKNRQNPANSPRIKPLRSVGRKRIDWQWCRELSQWYREHQGQRPNSRAGDEAEKTLAKRLHNSSQKYGSAAIFAHLDADVQVIPEVRLDLDPRGFFRELARKSTRNAEESLFFELCQYEISPRGFLLRWIGAGRVLPKSTDPQSRSGQNYLNGFNVRVV